MHNKIVVYVLLDFKKIKHCIVLTYIDLVDFNIQLT